MLKNLLLVIILVVSTISSAAITSNSIPLGWTDNSNNENGFLIERSTDRVNWRQIGNVATNIVTYVD